MRADPISCLGFAATVELIDLFLVLRKFREHEEFLHRERGELQNHESIE